jgi:hypothetical protein
MDSAPDEVSFELERFGWASEDRLEVAGRWIGVSRRLARPTLVVVVDGRRRRLRTLPGAWGSSAEGWAAAFAWQGGPVELDGAELEVGRSIVVDLPRPRRARQSVPAETADVHEERVVSAEPDAAKESEASAKREVAARVEAELDAARIEAAEARAALEREQEELAIARRALSAARESEEDERKDAQSVRSELETLRGELEKLRGDQERQAEELAGERSKLAAAEERVAAAVAAGREETQRLHEELASARTSPPLPQPQAEASPPAGRFASSRSEEPTRAQGVDREGTEERPRAQRLDSALSEERPRAARFEPTRPEERLPALVANRAPSVTERAAAWASGTAERARRAVGSNSSPENGSSERAAAPSPARVRTRPERVRVRSPQRAAELDSRRETSWALRAMAVGLVTVLLLALALIVSFLT